MNKTTKPNKTNTNKWYIIDAQYQTLGRISTLIAKTLIGKDNIYYNPSKINNVYVIVINAKKIQVSGNKKRDKAYYRHSGMPGGLKIETFQQLQARIPNRIIEKSVKGMLPKNKLGRQLFTQLKVYSDSFHPHIAQKPTQL